MTKSNTQSADTGHATKEHTVHCDDKDIRIISIFEGAETASKLLYELAVSRILYESSVHVSGSNWNQHGGGFA